MGSTASKHEQTRSKGNKRPSVAKDLKRSSSSAGAEVISSPWRNSSEKLTKTKGGVAPPPTSTTVAATTATTGHPLEEELTFGSKVQRPRQASTWSLGSLSGRLNWSFTGGANKNSFLNRSKSGRKSLTSAQQRRSKTTWHKPLTNAIFSSHFKESSRNEEFHIDHLVAKGAFGVVFKVIDKKVQKQQQQQKTPPLSSSAYALKVLRKSKVIEENSIQQIKDEADIQKLCGHHPFIVQQADLWQNRRNLHILSEYVPNGELFSKIAQFSLDLIRVYLAEIALAIDFLHNAGVIYRDVKPENILLTIDYHIKVTDFGLSKWLKLGATTKTMCGTFQYMAPEILRGQPYGHAVDWWSLGIIACQMFTEKSPDIKQFLNISLPSKIVAAHLNGDQVDNAALVSPNEFRSDGENPTIDDVAENNFESQSFLPVEVENLPHEAKDVLKRLLTVDPKQRTHSVLALQKIALYKGFKIEPKHLLGIHPLDIIHRDGIMIYTDNELDKSNGALANEAFQYF